MVKGKEELEMKKSKYIIFILLVISLIPIMSTTDFVLAEENEAYQREYKSNGDIGFYGCYEYPGPDKPAGTTPTIAETPEINENEQVKESSIGHSTLPKTGEIKENYRSIGITILLLLGGIVIYIYFQKRKGEKDENQ
ncbi:LPXTG cell wall anchor domain-containing protein [Enterococcus faecalis]|nr:LPXTG cell wall anchor domain-containing protein [Enterococcus faecalis]